MLILAVCKLTFSRWVCVCVDWLEFVILFAFWKVPSLTDKINCMKNSSTAWHFFYWICKILGACYHTCAVSDENQLSSWVMYHFTSYLPFSGDSFLVVNSVKILVLSIHAILSIFLHFLLYQICSLECYFVILIKSGTILFISFSNIYYFSSLWISVMSILDFWSYFTVYCLFDNILVLFSLFILEKKMFQCLKVYYFLFSSD